MRPLVVFTDDRSKPLFCVGRLFDATPTSLAPRLQYLLLQEREATQTWQEAKAKTVRRRGRRPSVAGRYRRWPSFKETSQVRHRRRPVLRHRVLLFRAAGPTLGSAAATRRRRHLGRTLASLRRSRHRGAIGKGEFLHGNAEECGRQAVAADRYRRREGHLWMEPEMAGRI